MGFPLGRLSVRGLARVGMTTGFLVTDIATRSVTTALPGIVFAAVINLGASMAACELLHGGVRCS